MELASFKVIFDLPVTRSSRLVMTSIRGISYLSGFKKSMSLAVTIPKSFPPMLPVSVIGIPKKDKKNTEEYSMNTGYIQRRGSIEINHFLHSLSSSVRTTSGLIGAVTYQSTQRYSVTSEIFSVLMQIWLPRREFNSGLACIFKEFSNCIPKSVKPFDPHTNLDINTKGYFGKSS